MEMAVRYAVLSYCADLTDPDAESRPIAMVGVGADSFGFFVMRPNPGDELAHDDVSRSVLNNLPALLQRQIREGFAEVGPVKFLSWLHDRYHNSLSVSAIETKSVSLPTSVDDALRQGTIMQPILRLYASVIRGVPTPVLLSKPVGPPSLPPQYSVVTTPGFDLHAP